MSRLSAGVVRPHRAGGPREDWTFAGFDIRPRGGKVTIQVEGLEAGARIEVVNEDGTVIANQGEFGDPFAPLAEHVYRLSLE